MSGTAGYGLRIGVLALVWGSTFLWTDLALASGLTPTQITLGRTALGALTLLSACRLMGLRLPKGWAVWRDLLIASLLCNTLPFLLFGIGQQQVESGVAGILNATTPLWAVMLGLVTGTERGRPAMRYVGFGVGLAGLVAIFTPWRAEGLFTGGALAILAAAASYAAAFAFMSRRLTRRGVPTLSLAAAQLLAATGCSALLTLADPQPLTVGWAGLATLLPLGMLCTGFTFALTYRLLSDEGAANTAVVSYLLPVVALGLGAAFLGETLSWTAVIGMIIVLLGVAMTRWPQRSTEQGPATRWPSRAKEGQIRS